MKFTEFISGLILIAMLGRCMKPKEMEIRDYTQYEIQMIKTERGNTMHNCALWLYVPSNR